MSNSFGQIFKWTSFGESHGQAMGVVIDGCPAGVPFNVEKLQTNLARRRPGQKTKSGNSVVTERNEADEVEIVSGIFEGKTLGSPIACFVKNQDSKSEDYDEIKDNSRVGHADDVWKNKYGHVDHRGGGRSSGRETLSRVIAGSVAEMFLSEKYPELKVLAFARQIGAHHLTEVELATIGTPGFKVDDFVARFPSKKVNMENYLTEAKERGESYGGIVEVWADGVPANLGEPVFHKLKSDLAMAMMSIGATCGFELGGGFELCRQPGTLVHTSAKNQIYGGIRGGISTGERIIFRVGFKPTSSITDVAKKGRHDPCIVPRAVPVVEAMTWAVLADHELLNRTSQ